MRRIFVSGLVLPALFLPFVAILLLSFVKGWTFPDIINQGLTVAHWQRITSGNTGPGRSVLFSILISVCQGTAATLAGFFTCRYIARHRWSNLLLVLAFFPYAIAPVVLAALWQYFFIVSNLSGTLQGILLAQFLFIYPYAVLFFSGFWTGQIRALESQAITLGATPWQLATRVLLPTAKPWLFICFFQCFLISWFEYGLTQLIGVGKVQTLTVKVFFFVQEANPYLAAVTGCLITLPPFLLLMINRRIFAHRLSIHDRGK